MALTPKKQIFVDEYLVDLNATQAAIRAGYSEDTAYSQGQRLLKDVDVARLVEDALDARSQRTKIDADWVLSQAAKLHQRCMQEVAPLTDRKGQQIRDDEGNPLYVFNAAGAAKALELVGKHIGVQAFKENVEHSGTIKHAHMTDAELDAEIAKYAGGGDGVTLQ